MEGFYGVERLNSSLTSSIMLKKKKKMKKKKLEGSLAVFGARCVLRPSKRAMWFGGCVRGSAITYATSRIYVTNSPLFVVRCGFILILILI